MKDRIRDYDMALGEIDAKIRYVNFPECWVQLWIGLRRERDALILTRERQNKVVCIKSFTERLA